ncbi:MULTISPECIES: ParA family protein [unclassified Coleofasciculus]|uniref:ParA family protein n=1 Tax=unclassified Coleofasciculus TaxID=2692782 RepID=UPI001880D499|nr:MULTISPECIES: ParA family protein [unclassified Coleofasciculus]MBE9130258.1 ParA family protein [Coleofasciculus sp. LEGE 07081]MBE9152534.1 ParA family protein [Coleofasciculus sp. LEGE 07092]
MRTIACLSLSGGQGKTTAALLLGRTLALNSSKVLVIDADPQANLTFYLGHQVAPDEPTLLEVMQREVDAVHGIYPLRYANLFLIPADNALNKVQDYLATSGMGAVVLRRRLEPVVNLFEYCIIDSPPQRTQICLSVVGAADFILIPVEASTKGVNSLLRSLELVEELRDIGAFSGQVLGVLPFRDRWFGRSQAKESRDAIEAMRQMAGDIPVLPSILESEQYKRAIRQGQTLSEMGLADLQYPFEKIIAQLDARR